MTAEPSRIQISKMEKKAIGVDSKEDVFIPLDLIKESASNNPRAEVALSTIQRMIVDGARVDRLQKAGSTPLASACDVAAMGAIKALAAGGASIEAIDGIGMTPLMICAMRGHAGALALLLELGANPLTQQERSRKGATALHYAAANNHGECAKILARAGDNFGREMACGATPLGLARDNGGESIMACYESEELEELLNAPAGAGVDEQPRRGRTRL